MEVQVTWIKDTVVEMKGFDLDNDQEEETAAEIERFRSFLSNALQLVDSQRKTEMQSTSLQMD